MKQLIGNIIIALAIVVLAMVAYMYKPLMERYVLVLSYRECAGAYWFEQTDRENNVVTRRPIEDKVTVCLAELTRK